MIDIDKVFNIEQNNNKKINSQNIVLNNPILYVFVGNDDTKVLEDIYEFNQSNQLNETKMIEYINIDTKVSDYVNNNNILIEVCEEENQIKKRKKIYNDFEKSNDILKIISYIELGFLEHTYSMPIRRRVHIIVNSGNIYSCILKKIVDVIVKFFTSRNLAPIIDIFNLINDKPDNTEVQKISSYAMIQELKEIGENIIYNINMIYIISNINSLRTISNQKDINISIARTAIIKDLNYNKQSYNFLYSDTRLIENAKNVSKDKRGIFYSLGLKTIERPIEALKFVALSQMISRNNFAIEQDIEEFLNKATNQINKIIADICKNPLKNNEFIDIDNISGIMIATNSIYNSSNTNIELIYNCFGDLLDRYFECNSKYNLNFDKNQISNYIYTTFNSWVLDINIGYFTAIDILYKIKSKCDDIKQNIKKMIYESDIKLESWKKEAPIIKRKLFENKYKSIFDIAREYIIHIYKIFAPKFALNVFEDFEITILSILSEYEILNKELEDSKKQLISIAENRILSNKDELTKNNFIPYYLNLVKVFIENNYKQYFELVYSKIFDLSKKDINLYYEQCLDYINRFILNQAQFDLNVYDEISKRLIDDGKGEYNEQSVNDLFNKEIADNKFYFIKLMNENNFYSNICVLMDNSNIIEKIYYSDINYIFYDEKYKLEILYFIGGFDDESLSYNNIYKDAYLKEMSYIEED